MRKCRNCEWKVNALAKFFNGDDFSPAMPGITPFQTWPVIGGAGSI
jgi:hypothetical protein